MRSAPAEISLIVPGLLPQVPRRALASFPEPQAPWLGRLLARAQSESFAGGDIETLVLPLFGLPPLRHNDGPLASLSCLADGGPAAHGWWLRADPVHLRADTDRLLLFDASVLDLTAAEASTLCAQFNAHFDGRDLRLLPLETTRWYLRFDHDPGLACTRLREVVGRDVHRGMPVGERGIHWKAVLNEVQMLFHDSSVNREREQSGRLPVNGVWLWGAGRLPASPETRWTGLWGDDPVAVGTALLSGVTVHDAVPSWNELLASSGGVGGHALVCCESLPSPLTAGEADPWKRATEKCEEVWLEPILRALLARDLGRVHLYPGDGFAYRLDRRALRWSWKRRARIVEHLAQK